jgi:quercetin dioxygenase-like cupin family protein
MNRTHRNSLLAVLLGGILATGLFTLGPGADRVSAQSIAQPLDLPCADSVGVVPLGQAMPDGAEGQALAALRVEIAPGGSLGLHTHPGTLIVAIEAGEFGFTMAESGTMGASHGEMQIMRAGTDSTPPAAEPVQAETEYVLTPGDWMVEPPGMAHSARALGDVPTIANVTGLVAPDQPFIQCLDGAPTS